MARSPLSPLSARQQVLMAVQDLAGKFNARMKSQSGDDLIVSTSERSSQLNAPVSINFNKKNYFYHQPGYEIIHFGGEEEWDKLQCQFPNL